MAMKYNTEDLDSLEFELPEIEPSSKLLNNAISTGSNMRKIYQSMHDLAIIRIPRLMSDDYRYDTSKTDLKTARDNRKELIRIATYSLKRYMKQAKVLALEYPDSEEIKNHMSFMNGFLELGLEQTAKANIKEVLAKMK